MNERYVTLAHRVSAMHAGHSPPRVRQRRDATLFPNYFGQTCYYYYIITTIIPRFPQSSRYGDNYRGYRGTATIIH